MELKEYTLPGQRRFSAAGTLTSGQCFRWTERGGRFCGTAFGRYVEIGQHDGELTIYGADEEDYRAVWRGYLDLDRDYEGIRKAVTGLEPRLCDSAEFAAGVHILAQEPSFPRTTTVRASAGSLRGCV